MMYKYIIILFAVCVAANVNTVHATNNTEGMCLALADNAGTYAKGKKMGIPKSKFYDQLDKGAITDRPELQRMMKMVLNFSYMIGLDSEATGRLVYLKCKAGDFD